MTNVDSPGTGAVLELDCFCQLIQSSTFHLEAHFWLDQPLAEG